MNINRINMQSVLGFLLLTCQIKISFLRHEAAYSVHIFPDKTGWRLVKKQQLEMTGFEQTQETKILK